MVHPIPKKKNSKKKHTDKSHQTNHITHRETRQNTTLESKRFVIIPKTEAKKKHTNDKKKQYFTH